MAKPEFMCAEMLRPPGAEDFFTPLTINERGVANRGNLWAPGQAITIRFLDGSSVLQSRVREYANEWTEHANIKFMWLDPKRETNIRISFSQGGGGCWSYIGRDSLLIYKDKPTMNLGWFEWAINEQNFKEARRVVLHEFGHMLGLQHEQIHPQNPIPWDEGAMLAFYKDYGWTIENVRKTYTGRYQEKGVTYSRYDPHSIMHYPVEDKFTRGNYVVEFSYDLSERDKQFIGELYPGL